MEKKQQQLQQLHRDKKVKNLGGFLIRRKKKKKKELSTRVVHAIKEEEEGGIRIPLVRALEASSFRCKFIQRMRKKEKSQSSTAASVFLEWLHASAAKRVEGLII